LTYADATTLAQVVTQLFQTSDNSNQGRGGRNNFFGGFGGPFGGGGDRGGNNSGGSQASGRVAAPRVTAVADDRSNSLVVTAPADQMQGIIELVNRMDVDVDAVTEKKVFRLVNADPQETADQLTTLFPDPSTQSNQRNRGFGFGPFGNFGGGGGGGRNNNSNQSERRVSQVKVTAVADPRTQSVIVSASRDTMPQISAIIEELDKDPAKKKRVHVIKVENRDPQELVQDLQSVIASDTSGGNFNNASRNANQSGSQLGSRQQSNIQNQGQNTGGFNQGFGQGNNRGLTGGR
jgi:general secretion pathway protein D